MTMVYGDDGGDDDDSDDDDRMNMMIIIAVKYQDDFVTVMLSLRIQGV